MKALIGFILILFVSSIIYFFITLNDKVDDGPTEIDKLNQMSQSSETLSDEDENQEKEFKNSLDDKRNEKKAPERNQERPINRDDEAEENILEEQEEDINTEDIPEYSEEVSSDDFKEFIGVALEELSAGDEMAEAIIVEMEKIAKAQPDHLEHVRHFYQECQRNPNLSSANQKLCQDYLEKISE